MKLGVVGAGTIVQEFLPKLVRMDGLSVLGLMDIVPDVIGRLSKENGVPLATCNFDTLCASGIDTVYVAVPNHLHFDYCKRALERGLHIIVEKPITSNLQEAEQLQQLAEEKGCFLFEAVTTVYLPEYETIREWLPRIGDIKLVQCQYSQYSRRYDAFRNGQILPVFDPAKAGGAMMDLNLYNLHFVTGLFGAPQQAEYHPNIERGIDTSGILLMQYDAFPALCIAAKDSKGYACSSIQGTKGRITTQYPANIIGDVTLELYDGTTETFRGTPIHDRLIPEFTAFIRAINEEDRSFCKKKLSNSLLVSRVQTETRLAAGIRFAADL